MTFDADINAHAKASDAVELTRRGIEPAEICDLLGMRPHSLAAALRADQISQQATSGRSARVIAAAMHIHRRTVERALAARRGVPRRDERRAQIAARRALVGQHEKAGYSSSASAQKLRVSRRTVQSDRAALRRT